MYTFENLNDHWLSFIHLGLECYVRAHVSLLSNACCLTDRYMEWGNFCVCKFVKLRRDIAIFAGRQMYPDIFLVVRGIWKFSVAFWVPLTGRLSFQLDYWRNFNVNTEKMEKWNKPGYLEGHNRSSGIRGVLEKGTEVPKRTLGPLKLGINILEKNSSSNFT